MPPRKREKMLATVPDTERAITFLRNEGQSAMAKAVQTTLDYAVEAAQPAGDKAARAESNADPNRSINVGKPFRDHVRAMAEAESVDVARLIRRKLAEFCDGTWLPFERERAAMGTAPEKAFITVRVSDDLWKRVDALGKDPDAIAWRGYKLNARQVAIAALRERFPMPGDKPVAEKTSAKR